MNETKCGIREVAQQAGVSFSTAAAVLRNEKRFTEQTRQRVLKAASELGYKKNLAASILGSRNSKGKQNYSVVYLCAPLDKIIPGFHSQRLPQLEAEGKARGFQIERFVARDQKSLHRAMRRWLATGVDGIIIGHSDIRTLKENFNFDAFTLISDVQEYLSEGLDCVRANHFKSNLNLLHTLHGRGYRRIGVMVRHHHTPILDDLSRLGSSLAFRDLHRSGDTFVDVCWKPFAANPETNLDQHKRDTEDLVNWTHKHNLDVFVDFRIGRYPEIMEIFNCDFAAMSVAPHNLGKLAGTGHDQDFVVQGLLEYLERKIRNEERGFLKHPIEHVVTPPFLEGPSIRPPQ